MTLLEAEKWYAVHTETKAVDVSKAFKCVWGAINYGNKRGREGKGAYAPWRGKYILADSQFTIPQVHSLPMHG